MKVREITPRLTGRDATEHVFWALWNESRGLWKDAATHWYFASQSAHTNLAKSFYEQRRRLAKSIWSSAS